MELAEVGIERMNWIQLTDKGTAWTVVTNYAGITIEVVVVT